jgi:hydroxyacylglutathione hydrolase
MVQIHRIVSAPFEENTYIVWQPPRKDVVVIDPGLEPDLVLDFLRENGLAVSAILNTHGHADHIGGNADVKAAFPDAALQIGAGDEPMLADADKNLSAPFGMPVTSPPADRLLVEGDVVEVAGMRLEVREIPGHSPGHVVFILRAEPIVVFGGDVLFQGSVGRTDFPGGSARQLFDGIRAKLFTLAADTVVYPGHGLATTVGVEKRTNPYVADPS